MSKKILITSALPYANGPLHFGHIAGAYLPADCYSRFQRLEKNDVLFICGSDEYGVAITLSAEIAGRTPEEHIGIYHEVLQEFFKKLNINFDHYSRTTWPGHVKRTQQYFLDLLNNGYIEERVTEQLFSEADNKFLADRYVMGTCPRCHFEGARGDECQKCGASYEATDLINPRSKLTQSPLVKKETKHWFLLLDKFKEQLLKWLETKKWKINVTNFVKGYIEELRPRSITRDLPWGVPVPLPEAQGKVIYVWFDAPIGYISATQEWAEKNGHPDLWKEYWSDPETHLVQFIGKDNIPFHAVIFPAMTMGQNQTFKLVDELPANEFYNLEGRQFSKSDGWYIDLDEFFKNYTADQIRYTIAANAPETSDSEFTWKDFQLRCNTELLGKFGNFVNRVLVFAHKNCEGKIPSLNVLQPLDEEFLKKIGEIASQAREAYATFKVRRASQLLMELAQHGNAYFDAKRPWQDAKNEETKRFMETTIACCMQCLKNLALVSYPIIPSTAEAIWRMLGCQEELMNLGWEQIANLSLPAGQALREPKILFSRVEAEEIEKEISHLHSTLEAKTNEGGKKELTELLPLKEPVSIQDIDRLDLRVGTILSAEPLAKSKKLLKLLVDLGFEKRVIVSGIRHHYEPSQLIGKKVVVVANLKPATLMGVESQGMLLAASFGELLEVIELQDLPNGSIVG